MIDVVVISDSSLFRTGIELLLQREEGLQVAASGAAMDEVSAHLDRPSPVAALVDMASARAVETVRGIAGRFPRSRIVALGIGARGDVLDCAEAGVAGYLTREGSVKELLKTVECAVAGELICTPQIAGALLGRVGRLSARIEGLKRAKLTPREIEIAALLEEGLSNKAIARRLEIRVPTVKNHVHNILEKLGTHRRAVAAARIRRAGLVPTPRG